MAKSRKKRKATRRKGPTPPAQQRPVPSAPPEAVEPTVDEEPEPTLPEGLDQDTTHEEPAEPEELAQDGTPDPADQVAVPEEPAQDGTAGPADQLAEPDDAAEESPTGEEPAAATEEPAEPDDAAEESPTGEEPAAATEEPAEPDDAEEGPTGEEPAAATEDRSSETSPHGNMPVSTRHAWRRLGRLLRPRVSGGNVLAALMTLAVGFALVAQVQAAHDVGLQDLSETDLVGLLDDVTERADSLEEEIRLLEADKRALQQDSGEEAAEAAEARLTSHQILAGTVTVEGPGITMSVSAPDGGFTPTMMIDVMQELRNAGAEAIQIGQVRVVASTWIGVVDGNLTVDGQLVEAPFRIVAIGDPHTLAGAMAIPGGFTDSVRGIDGDVQVIEGDSLVVDALHSPDEPQYARPVLSE